MAVHLSWIERADLVDVAADGDDSRDLGIEKCIHMLRCVGGNVDADLFQHLDCLWVNEAGGFRPCAVHVDEIASGSIEDSFSHMATARIPGAEDEDVGLHDR